MNIRSGIILAGGTGSRIAPLSDVFNKHLIPIYNKFVIDYPIETLRNIGVTNLTVVLGGPHFNQIVSYLKDGSQFGMFINYIYQIRPIGIAQAINICQPYIDEKFAVILGDNIFEKPIKFSDCNKSAQIVLHKHKELHRFGVASYKDNVLVSLEEKPKAINYDYENYAITGCYLFDKQFFDFYNTLKPSARGEYEITDIIRLYAENNDLGCVYSDGEWLDAGTHESINYTNNFFYNKKK